jgi:hypothetical protein
MKGLVSGTESPTGSSIILIFEADDQIAPLFCPELAVGDAGDEPVEGWVERSQAPATVTTINSRPIRLNVPPLRSAPKDVRRYRFPLVGVDRKSDGERG